MTHGQHAQFLAISCKARAVSSIQSWSHMQRSSKASAIAYNDVSDSGMLNFKKMYGKEHDMRKRYNF